MGSKIPPVDERIGQLPPNVVKEFLRFSGFSNNSLRAFLEANAIVNEERNPHTLGAATEVTFDFDGQSTSQSIPLTTLWGEINYYPLYSSL